MLASLGAGGVETWLIHMLRTIDPARFRFDVLLNSGETRFYDAEAERLGATIQRGPPPQQPLAYRHELRRVLAAGSYDAVHSHLYLFSGYVLREAHRSGVPIRVAHSHNAQPPRRGLARRGHEAVMRRLIWRHATRGTAVSDGAAYSLFGPAWPGDERFGVMGLGFDFSRFRYDGPQAEARARFGIPAERRVIGHIGSFSPQKNHGFLLDVFAQLLARGVDAHLLVLTSPTAAPLRALVAQRTMRDRVTVVETGSDVPALLAVLDLFVLPSRWEGGPIVVLEAQAAGVQVLASEAMAPSHSVVPGMVTQLSLTAGPEAWAAEAAGLLGRAPPDRAAANDAMRGSEFGVERGWARLAELYAEPRV